MLYEMIIVQIDLHQKHRKDSNFDNQLCYLHN